MKIGTYKAILYIFSFYSLAIQAKTKSKIKKPPPTPASAPKIKEFFSTFITTMYGSGSYTYEKKAPIAIKKKIGIDWKDYSFKTDNLTTLRISDLNSGVWSILPSSEFKILDTLEHAENNPFDRTGKLISGEMRLKPLVELNHIEKIDLNEKKKSVTLKTDELKILIPRGTDLILSREKNFSDGSYTTKVYSLSGIIYVQPNPEVLNRNNNQDNKEIPIQPGLVFSISSNGIIAPLVSPSSRDIDHVLALTTTAEDIASKRSYADNENIKDLIEKCSILEKRYEFYEIINIFHSFIHDYKKHPQIPYCLGIGSSGLNQNRKAIKYFNDAISMNKDYTDAHWQLGLVYLKEKIYHLAQRELNLAYKGLSKNGRRIHEYKYYLAVINYFQMNYLEAKNLFTECSTNPNLSSVLRNSSVDYLSKIQVTKPWSLIVPIGLTYDDNALSLAQNQSLPTSFSSQSVWKFFGGAIFDYDKSLSTMKNGWFLGAQAKVFTVKNLDPDYSVLDASVLDGTFFLTKRFESIDGQNSFRLYLSNGIIYIDNNQDTYYFLGGVKYKTFDFNAGMNQDISARLENEKTNATIFNQYYNDIYQNWGLFIPSLSSQLQEKITENKTINFGNAINLIASPSLTYPFTEKLNTSFTQTFDFTWTQANEQISTYKFLPTISLNYFMTSWLLTSVTGVYEYGIEQPGDNYVIRPQATLYLIGIF